jgi:hypothetical protein
MVARMPNRTMLPAVTAAIGCLALVVGWAVFASVLVRDQPPPVDMFGADRLGRAGIVVITLALVGVAIPAITAAWSESQPGRVGLALVMAVYGVVLPWLVWKFASDANSVLCVATGAAWIAALTAAFPSRERE